MDGSSFFSWCSRSVILLGAILAGERLAWAQSNSEDDGGFVIRDGNAGYIDLAIPGNQIRLLFDSGYDLDRPTRAEFFYAKRGPGGPGLPLPERSVDYQQAAIYLEQLIGPEVSAFVQVDLRSINPEINNNSTGLGDISAGAKIALISTPDLLLSGQLRVYAPTGDTERGLGTGHTSLEPALLLFAPLDDRLALLGEFRYWIPIGGTDFAGNVLRYGLGAQYELYQSETTNIVPIVELVGWTALDGQSAVPSATFPARSEDASGDTIVNLKLGARFGLGSRTDFYAGYGRSLTGDRWYEDIARFELRYVY